MERVVFLIEATHQRIPCLLNPESLVLRRWAGVQSQRVATGRVAATALREDPLLFTGGGYTEIDLDLLFDVTLAEGPSRANDVRAYTRPLWTLAEQAQVGDQKAPPILRFIWGKTWNIPAVVVALAERLDDFTPAGIPRRSWLRLRLRRVELPSQPPRAHTAMPSLPALRTERPVRTHQPLAGNVLPGIISELDLGALLLDDEAVLSVDILIHQVLKETGLWDQLSLWAEALFSLVETTYDAAKAWVSEKVQPYWHTLRRFLDQIHQAAQSLLRPAGAAMLRTWAWAKANLDAAWEGVKGLMAQIARRADALSQPVREGFRRVGQAIMERVKSIAQALSGAAKSLLHGVQRLAQRVLSPLAHGVGRGLQRVTDLVAQAAQTLAHLGSTLWQEAKEAAAQLQDLFQQWKTRGRAQMKSWGTALDRLMSLADHLWEQGRAALARQLGRVVASLARGWKRLSALSQALFVSAAHGAARALGAALDEIKALLQKESGDDEEDPPSAEHLAQAGHRLAASLAFWQELRSAPLPSPLVSSIETLQNQLLPIEGAAPLPSAQLNAILAHLTQAQTLVREAVNAEREAVIHTLQSYLEAPPPAIEPLVHLEFGERLDQLAYRVYGDPRYWRVLATFNHIADPLHLQPNIPLRIPAVD